MVTYIEVIRQTVFSHAKVMVNGVSSDLSLTRTCTTSIFFVGYRQTVDTQIRRHRTRRLIRVSTVLLAC